MFIIRLHVRHLYEKCSKTQNLSWQKNLCISLRYFPVFTFRIRSGNSFVPRTEAPTAAILVYERYRIKIVNGLQCHNVKVTIDGVSIGNRIH
jgi:hypothetical protein